MSPGGIARALVASLALSVSVLAPARAAELSDDKIIRDFDVVVFRNEMYQLPDPRVHKWVGPVRVFVRDETPIDAPVERILNAQLERLVPKAYREFFPGKDACADGCFYLHDGTVWSFYKGGFLDE